MPATMGQGIAVDRSFISSLSAQAPHHDLHTIQCREVGLTIVDQCLHVSTIQVLNRFLTLADDILRRP